MATTAEEAPSSALPASPGRHAHLDCSQGVDCSRLLDACLDAWRTLKRSNLQSDSDGLSSVIRDLFPVSTDAIAISLRRGDPDGNTRIQWQCQNDEIAAKIDFSNARECFENSRVSPHIKEQALQVIAHMEDAVQEALSRTNYVPSMEEEEEFQYFSLHVACILWLIHQLQIKGVSLSPLPCQGASLAVLQLLIGMPTNPNREAVVITPTASAILKVLFEDSTGTLTDCPPITLEAVGASSASEPSVRVLVGTPIVPPKDDNDNNSTLLPELHPWKTDRLVHMQANLDDLSAEALAFAVEVLLKNGAADAWVAPIVMKKGRAAHTLHCLCRSKLWKDLLELLFQHTTTLGVRIHRDVERAALPRRLVTVHTPYSETQTVDVKMGYWDDKIISVKAEFDHCRSISLETGIPIQQIAARAVQEAVSEMERLRDKQKLRDTAKVQAKVNKTPERRSNPDTPNLETVEEGEVYHSPVINPFSTRRV